MSGLAVILGLTVAACLVVGLAGAGLLHLTRRSSIRYQLTIATLVPVVAVVATVLLNVRFMFLSTHDSVVVLVALATSLALAVIVSYLVMRRVVQAFLQVGEGLHQLVEDTTASQRDPVTSKDPTTSSVPQELARVIADLAATRATLTESRARERALEQSRRELVSFMSHDLRTPLAGLRAISEGLEDGVIEDVPRALAHLRGTVSRMTGLVDDLFALSRVQGPPETKQEQLVSVTEILTDVVFELSATAAARQIELDLVAPTNDRLAVLGTADDLTRALANLVINAIRHTEPGLTVRLGGRRVDDRRIQIAVTDACGGIPEDDLPHVFDAGWRGSSSRSGDDGGAGLGLAIARGVVQSHHGEIGVSNVEGGCRFEVDLPAAKTDPATTGPRS
jgi:signal transduction histidine kinase